MADWNLPATTTTYVNVLASLKDRDLDSAKLFDGVTVTNPATGMIRWSSANARLEKWDGSAWVALAATHAISISGSSASCTGNAATATTLATARTINGVSFNGTANITVTANTTQTLTCGGYLTGSNFNGAAETTWAVDATSANTVSKVVARDASGNFAAGTITAALNGTAANATTLATARTLTIGATGKTFNGSANVAWSKAEVGVFPAAITTTSGSKTLVDYELCTVLAAGLTITLPALPAAGNMVGICIAGEITNTTIERNAQNIMGLAENMTIDKGNVTVTMVFVDSTRGWRIV